jgi:hypothetical protein
MLRRKFTALFLLFAFAAPGIAVGQTKIYTAPKDVIDQIREEGLKNSKVMEHLWYLTDVIGPRLTNSPGMKRANEWSRDELAKWGLNARLESWGPFGRGWTLKKFSAQVIEPVPFTMIAYPKAWSPGTDSVIPVPTPDPKAKKGAAPAAQPSTVLTSEVVYFNPKDEAEMAKFKGQLKGKIVLVGAMRRTEGHFEPDGRRLTEKDLLQLANAPDPATQRGGGQNFGPQSDFLRKRFNFLVDEGVAALIDIFFKGDGGTVFITGAAVPQPDPPTDIVSAILPRKTAYAMDASKTPVQVGVTTEHFNRLVRLIEKGEKVKVSLDVGVEFQTADPMGYNTIAEIPGSDLKDEVVMLGAHMDSWHAGTGATDNASGTAVMMEAVRIIQTLGLKPRRTVRIALWSGEEQGLLGSRAYVREHFGQFGDGSNAAAFGAMFGGQRPPLTKKPDYDKFSAYYNLDNGTGKIRGVYMQGNEAVRPYFREWLAPFRDLGAETLTIANTGGTDHQAFDAIGLPGFQFIQDPVEYSTRSHHSNMDVFDRIQPDDMKQAATIIAAFVYQTAMMDEKLPRKPMS